MTADLRAGVRPRLTLRRIVLALVLLVLVVYGTAVAYLFARQTKILFQAGAPLGALRPRPPFDQIELSRADGTKQLVWLMPHAGAADGLPWLIFLHGNGAPVAARLNILHYERLRELGVNVIAPEYRGFGGTPGVPSESGLESDARAAYEYVRAHLQVPAPRIIIYGWSLGAAVAVDLAADVPEAAVVVEGAPASLVDIGQLRYPFMPIRLLMRDPFDVILKVNRIDAPMLFLHSPEDAVIPIAEGRRLFDRARGPKRFVEVSGGHVYAAERDPRLFEAVGAFLKTQGLR
jgi:uncharacterized protein